MYDRYVGTHIESLPESDGWEGLYPLIDCTGMIAGITDVRADNDEIIVDWDASAHAPVIREGACDAAISMSDLSDEQRQAAREMLGIED